MLKRTMNIGFQAVKKMEQTRFIQTNLKLTMMFGKSIGRKSETTPKCQKVNHPKSPLNIPNNISIAI